MYYVRLILISQGSSRNGIFTFNRNKPNKNHDTKYKPLLVVCKEGLSDIYVSWVGMRNKSIF